MRTVGLPPGVAQALLVTLARHLPPGVAQGRPLAALRSPSGAVQVITSLCVWFISAEEAARLLPMSGNRVELTTFEHGRETSRIVRGWDHPQVGADRAPGAASAT